MSWRIFATDTSQPDFERLSDEERELLADELFRWVETGPPRSNVRVVAGAQLFEDRLVSGFTVVYFVNEDEPYVGIVRVRRSG